MQLFLTPQGWHIFAISVIFHPFGVGYCVVLFFYKHVIPSGFFSRPNYALSGRHKAWTTGERETPWQGVSTALPAVKLFWQVARFRQTGSLRYFFLCALCCEYHSWVSLCSTQPYVAEISTGYHKSLCLRGFVALCEETTHPYQWSGMSSVCPIFMSFLSPKVAVLASRMVFHLAPSS